MIQLKHLFKTILRYKLSSGLTLLSLVVAFIGIIVLSLYISFERSFDSFHENGDEIYFFTYNGETNRVPALLLQEFLNEIPDIEQGVVVWPWGETGLKRLDDNSKDAINVKTTAFGKDFFTMFDFPLMYGDPESALNEPMSVVISQKVAQMVFGEEDPLGKQLSLGQLLPFKVTGVMYDMPKNTAFKNDVIISFETFMQPGRDWIGAQQWSEWSYNIFIQLTPGANSKIVEEKISNISAVSNVLDRMKSQNPKLGFVKLVPLKEIHYMQGLFYPTISKTVLDILILLTFILITMGIVNFINFSTSQAPLRAKSLSIQQIMGEKKWHSRMQIVGEAVILSVVGLIIALIIHDLAYNYIQNEFGIQGLALDGRYSLMVWFLLFAIVFGVAAGWYPSRYITLPPVCQAVKGKMNFAGKGKGFRQMLITIQFVFTIVMIVAALTIEKQLNFWRNFDLGIDKENVVYFFTTDKLQQSHQALADELLKNNEIVDYTYSQFIPGYVGMGWSRWIDDQHISFKCWPIDDRFFNFFGLKVIDGREFLKGEGDINSFIINEKAVEIFGWENPLEKKLPGFDFEGDILGIAQNFNFSSLRHEIEPMTFWLTNTRKNVLMLKVKATNYTNLIRFIKEVALSFDGEARVEPHFLDNTLERLYEKEERLADFIEFIAVWCILLALTGLLGITIFISRDRVKEIGIRKVNGATTVEIMAMLNSNIVAWVAIAFVIATPIAYFAMSQWLQNFAYRTPLSWWVFALAGVLALVIALLTVSWQSWLAARRNPVEALRYE